MCIFFFFIIFFCRCRRRPEGGQRTMLETVGYLEVVVGDCIDFASRDQSTASQ